jgi:hypothetical protein
MDFSETILAQIKGRKIRRARLVEFDFVSGPIRVWNGARRLRTKDGKEWQGMFGFGRIEGLQQAINGDAPEMRFSVSGVAAAFVQKARGEASEYFNRRVLVFSQFFAGEDDEDFNPWEPIDNPFAEAWGIMRALTYEKTAEEGGFRRIVTISAETPFGATKKRPPFSYVTDTDQRQRFPDDRGMERVAGIEAKLIEFSPE